ncbi:MAG: transposase [Rickettsia endosymbiont of Labidopullus appendiculatus]|nr:transposase [Rickettsia endosymbiont of Labidopullus appendiculatus]
MQSKGKSKGGMSTKLHLAMTTSWHIIEGFLTGGNRNDIAVAEELTANIVGCDVIQDRGYDSNKNRQNLESRNNITVIPGRKIEKQKLFIIEKNTNLEELLKDSLEK